MSEVSIRTRTTYTVTEVTNPITLDIELFKKCKPAFEGETEKEFHQYICDNLGDYNGEDFINDNEEILGDEVADLLWYTFVEPEMSVMFDSRNNSEEIVIELGDIDESYRKYGGFNSRIDNEYFY